MSTIVGIATAPGIGGIGIIRMSGEKTFEILDKIFIPKTKQDISEIKGFGRSAPRSRHTDGPKRASGSCILQRESLLLQQTSPTRLGSGKQRKPFSPPALCSPEGKVGRGCPWLPGPYCFAGGLRPPKPTPQGFSLVWKQDWAREGLLRPGPSHAP